MYIYTVTVTLYGETRRRRLRLARRGREPFRNASIRDRRKRRRAIGATPIQLLVCSQNSFVKIRYVQISAYILRNHLDVQASLVAAFLKSTYVNKGFIKFHQKVC